MKNHHNLILFEDEDFIIVNKPAGLLCIADGFNSDLPCLKKELEHVFGRIWTVHRLDKATSGVLIFAKDDCAHRILNQQFEQHLVRKNYRAICFGFPVWNQRVCEIPLRKNAGRRHRTVADTLHGKQALTRFVVLKRSLGFCELDVFPLSGITHQIRSHAAMLGLPIVGDDIYGFFQSRHKTAESPLDKWEHRLYLHSLNISFYHPRNNDLIDFTAPLPESFQRINFQNQ